MAYVDYCETIIGIPCPACQKLIWINEGNTQDMTVGDSDGAICPWCNNKFTYDELPSPEELGYEKDKTIDDYDLAKGYKTPNEAAGIT